MTSHLITPLQQPVHTTRFLPSEMALPTAVAPAGRHHPRLLAARDFSVISLNAISLFPALMIVRGLFLLVSVFEEGVMPIDVMKASLIWIGLGMVALMSIRSLAARLDD